MRFRATALSLLFVRSFAVIWNPASCRKSAGTTCSTAFLSSQSFTSSLGSSSSTRWIRRTAPSTVFATTIMTSTHTNDAASREELRRIRCALYDTANRSSEQDVADLDQSDHGKKPASKAKAKTDRDVIDLLDSSTDEDDYDAKPQTKSIKLTESSKGKIAKTESLEKSNRVVVDLWESSDEDKAEDEPRKKKKLTQSGRDKKATASFEPNERSVVDSDSSEKAKGKEISFQLVSYNLWFGPQRNGSPHVQDRMQAVADLLLKRNNPPLYFMGFQEVVHPIDDALFPLLSSAGYQIIRQPLDNPIFLPYGVALALHPTLTIMDSGWKPYKMTQMDRGFVYAHCQLPNGMTCLVTSTHLESFISKENNGSTARVHQFRAMEEYCNKLVDTRKVDMALMMGDLNWDDTSRNPTDVVLDSVLSSKEWKDAWLSTNHLRQTVDARKGYTYDAKLNPMLGGNLRRRFDRCLVRAASGTNAVPSNTCLVGQEALPGLTFDKENPYTNTVRKALTAPSDHFGLVVELQASLARAKKG